ncbi:MAG: aspartate--tRNA(Asn) ligase [Candidatus Methanomethylophilus sp.]|nr:aspartate--tRNA(Asn) ligase [Methanomethylophilus sp.]
MAILRDSSTIAVADGTATVHGWVQDTRNLGGISFVTLRDRYGTIQITLPKKKIEPALFEQLTKLPRESVVAVTGEVKESKQTSLGLELIPTFCQVFSTAASPLPIGVIDKVNVEMDTRLNSRFMDLRKPEIRAIFELRDIAVALIGEAMRSEHFVNVATPKIAATGAEGGATLFKVDYFGKPAFLAQSPQLYKQMLMSTGLDRVYEIGPAFRAEHSNTVRHVTEFTSFDGEFCWIDREEDVMTMIGKVINYVLAGLKERGAKQLALLGKDIRVPELPYPVLTYSECLKMVQDAGLPLKEGDDLGTDGEKIIGEIMGKKGIELYFIAEYPEEAKPFYIMVKDGTPYSYSFDLDFKGQEISSGGQREHRYDVLVARMHKKGLDPADFEDYLAAFKYGMPPHGGWGIGIDRFIEKLLDLPNVREAILFPRDLNRLRP